MTTPHKPRTAQPTPLVQRFIDDCERIIKTDCTAWQADQAREVLAYIRFLEKDCRATQRAMHRLLTAALPTQASQEETNGK